MGLIATVRGQFAQLPQVLIAGCSRIAVVKAASARDLLQAHVEHAGPQAMLEALVEVADLPELFFNPAGFDAALEITEGGCRRVALFERFEGRLGGERAALDRQVDALQPGGIQESCRVS